jgi:hypothetical protein
MSEVNYDNKYHISSEIFRNNSIDDDGFIFSRLKILFNNTNEDCYNSNNNNNYDDDDDDDPIIKRKRKDRYDEIISLSHMKSSSIEDVGLQVWKSSLVLSDYLIYKSINNYSNNTSNNTNNSNNNNINDKIIFELGCGCGLIGVVLNIVNKYGFASNVAKKLYLTDYRQDIINLARQNIIRNQINNNYNNKIKYSDRDFVNVRILDWNDTITINTTTTSTTSTTTTTNNNNNNNNNSNNNNNNHISVSDVMTLTTNEVIYIAADVIYDDELTKLYLSIYIYIYIYIYFLI